MDDSRETRDGLIDFSHYSIAQLQDMQSTIDRNRFPLNHQRLLEELQHRHADGATTSVITGLFTAHEGLRGWLEARKIRSPVYGSGTLQFNGAAIIVSGWKRTWLGTAIQTQTEIPSAQIRYLTIDGSDLRMDFGRSWRRVERLCFRTESPDVAEQFAVRIAGRISPADQQRWRQVDEFNAKLRAASRAVIVTPIIVGTTCLAYAALCLITHQLGGFDLPTLSAWGANNGPLTVNGQWWRLISAGFVHANLPHVIFNMWALWNIGRLVERIFGPITIVFLYFASLALASLSTIVWNPPLISVGASGAIFGIFGAFLAFFLNPRNRVPLAVARQHWVSTSIFVAFNLLNGFFEPQIDNAAHVGGLFAGFVLGWLLARPLTASGRPPLLTAQLGATTAFLALSTVLALWQVTGAGSQLTPVEEFLKSHSDYVQGESTNLRLWNQLAAAAGAGTVSDDELGRRFERDILPFWRSSHARFDKEMMTIKGPQRPFAALVAEWVQVRLQWAEKIVAASKDSQLVSEILPLSNKNDALLVRMERLGLRAAMEHRPRALANNAIVQMLRRPLLAWINKCLDAPSVLGQTPSVGDNVNDGPAVRHRVGCEAQWLFLSGDFRTLDTLMNRTAKSIGDLPDGSSTYQGIIDGLANLVEFGRFDLKALLERTADWRRRVPGSGKPDVLEAQIFSEYAWSARGSGYASSISPQTWRIFKYRTEMAAAGLEDSRDISRSDPAWYVLSLHVGLDQGLDSTTLRKIYDEGAQHFSNYLPLESAMMRILMPRWGGSYDDVDQFINQNYNQARDNGGLGRYATLYWRYAVLEGDDVDLFAKTHADWGSMRGGFLGLVKEYPDSDFVLNQFANSACRASDKDQYHELRPLLSRRFSSLAWSPKYTLEACDRKLGWTVHGTTTATSATEPPTPLVQVPDRGTAKEDAAGVPFIVALGGVRLSMRTSELLAAKGAPLRREQNYWTYNTVDNRHDGLISVGLAETPGASERQVLSVEYVGDEESAPHEVPFLKGESKQDVFDRYGAPVATALHGDLMSYQFANGVYISTRNDRVLLYGIAKRKGDSR